MTETFWMKSHPRRTRTRRWWRWWWSVLD